MDFRVIGPCVNVKTIAIGARIRDIEYLRITYGKGRWLKRKGRCRVEFADGTVTTRGVHWYEAHGIGKVDEKLKES